MSDDMDLLTAEKRDLKELGGIVLLLALASGLGMAESYPPNALIAVCNLIGLFLFIPSFIGTIRILKRGTPAIIVLGIAVLLLASALLIRTTKWFFQL